MCFYTGLPAAQLFIQIWRRIHDGSFLTFFLLYFKQLGLELFLETKPVCLAGPPLSQTYPTDSLTRLVNGDCNIATSSVPTCTSSTVQLAASALLISPRFPLQLLTLLSVALNLVSATAWGLAFFEYGIWAYLRLKHNALCTTVISVMPLDNHEVRQPQRMRLSGVSCSLYSRTLAVALNNIYTISIYVSSSSSKRSALKNYFKGQKYLYFLC